MDAIPGGCHKPAQHDDPRSSWRNHRVANQLWTCRCL